MSVQLREREITRAVSALGATEIAIAMGISLLTLQAVFAPTLMPQIMDALGQLSDLGSIFSTVTVWSQYWIVACLLIIYPAWFFALAAMRPLTAILILALVVILNVVSQYWVWGAMAETIASSPNPTLSLILGLMPLVMYAPVVVWLLIAPLRVLRLNKEERLISRPLAPIKGYLGLIRSMFGVWPNLRRSLWQSSLGGLFIYVATLFTSVNIAVRLILVLTLIALPLITLSQLIRVDYLYGLPMQDWIKPIGIAALTMLLAAVFYTLLASFFLWLAQRARATARHLSRQSLEKQIARDTRPPVLFLRSFRDDQVTLPLPGFWTRFLRGEPKERRLDHLLVENFSRYGPIVAIGRPGETEMPFGAARIYVGDDRWQDEVQSLASRAAHIVVVADPTPGVAWELQTMLGVQFADKTLFLAAPGLDVLINPVMRAWSREHTNLGDDDSYMIGLFRKHGVFEALRVKAPSADAYQIALQAFFRRNA